MTESHARHGSPRVFDFEGDGDEALQCLEAAYGTTLRVTGPTGTVRHQRVDHGDIAFDHIEISTKFAFDSDPLPALVVVDVLRGDVEYSRDHHTDLGADGDTVLASGWDMPITGRSDGYEIRATSISAHAVMAAVEDVNSDVPWDRVRFHSYIPRTPENGARWRATVDELSASFPDPRDELAHAEAARLLGHTMLQTFPNNVVDEADRLTVDRDSRDGGPATLRRAVRVIEARAHEDLTLAQLAHECRVSPRALQYAFRQNLGCTPLDYLRRVRLDLVRQLLRDGSCESVGEAAARFGFFHPGRFAAEYRRVFDENPGQTLSRTRPEG